MAGTISRPELKAMLDRKENVCLIEALPLHTYEQGHLPGAMPLPPDEVRDYASHRLPDLKAAIVVYSESAGCGNAQRVAQELEGLGYKNVRVYAEGKADWVDTGHELQAGLPDMIPADQARQSAEKAFQKT